MNVPKRCFDVIFSLLLMLLLWPLLLWSMLGVLRNDGGPIFYGSERMKTPHQSFTLWKLRTMRPDTADHGVTGGGKSARISEYGAKLRARRLDELPQLWNILRGDMSFVGPRPELKTYVEAAPELFSEVLKCRPGVTGMATAVYHRHEAELLLKAPSQQETEEIYRRRCLPQKARLDLTYREHQSMCFDLVLIAKTFGLVADVRWGRQGHRPSKRISRPPHSDQ